MQIFDLVVVLLSILTLTPESGIPPEVKTFPHTSFALRGNFIPFCNDFGWRTEKSESDTNKLGCEDYTLSFSSALCSLSLSLSHSFSSSLPSLLPRVTGDSRPANLPGLWHRAITSPHNQPPRGLHHPRHQRLCHPFRRHWLR